jgi:tRNA/rRNA methyltransferase
MAGTDSTRQPAAGGGPVVILVAPQLGENVGTAARAMLNCGLTELRLVRPRDGWPNPKARAAASGADIVIDGTRIYDTTEVAIADLQHVHATTVRPRGMVKPVLTPRAAAAELRARIAAGARAGILFGPERAGLDNDDVALAESIITAPLNPAFGSLNLAQAVLLVAYEWFQAGLEESIHAPAPAAPVAPVARQDDLQRLYAHLEQELDAAGFFRVPDKRPGMVRNIRAMLARANLTDQEVRTLHGIVTALSGRRLGGKARGREE